MAIVPEDAPHTVLGQGIAVPGEEQPVRFQPDRWRTVAVDVAHQVLGHFATHWHHPLLVAFPQYLELGFLQRHVGQQQTDEFGDPQPGVQQGQDDGIIPIPLGGVGVDDGQQLPDLVGGEGGDDLLGRPRYLHHSEGVRFQESLGHQPGEESPNTAQVGIDGMTGETPVLGRGPGMPVKAGFLPEIEDKGPDLPCGNQPDLGGGPEVRQEVLQIGDAGEDNIDGIWALSLGGGAEGIVLFEVV